MIVVLLFMVLMALRLPPVQTFLAQKLTAFLGEKMETTVTVDRVEIIFFDEVRLKGIYMEDLTGDTMIYAGVLDVNIDAFKVLQQEISLSDVDLKDGKFYMRRRVQDEKFNLSLFSKLFPPKEEKKESKPWSISLGTLKLENAHYGLIDSLNQTFLSVYLPYGKFQMEAIDFETGLVDVGSADIRQPKVALLIDESLRTDTQKAKTGPDTMHILPKNLTIHYTDVCLTNGNFSLRNLRGDTVSTGMDFNDMEITGIQLDVSDGGLIRDTIFADIEYLAGREKCGMEILTMKSKTRVSTTGIFCDSLYLKTLDSEISNYIALTFNGFSAFSNFITEVRMEGDFENSRISMEEINYFAKALDPIAHNNVGISGKVSGTVSNLRGRDLQLALGNRTTFDGKFSLMGLPNIKETFISFDCEELKTNYSDLKKIYPSVDYPSEIGRLGNVNFKGNFDGFINNFVTYGELKTDIGSISSDINLELVDGPEQASYSGSLAMNSFDLGRLTGDTENLGKVSLNGSLNGEGFKMEELEAKLDADIPSLVIKGFAYENIDINGEFTQREFTGEVDIDMPDISFNFNGIADFNDSLPKFNFNAKLRQAHLAKLNITEAPFQLSATMQVDLTGNSPDNAISNIVMQNLRIVREADTFRSNNIEVSSSFSDGLKNLVFTSDFAEGQMIGDFRYTGISGALKYLLSRSEPATFGQQPKPERDQQLELDLVIYNPKKLPQILLPSLKMIRNSKIYGSLNTKTEKLSLEASIPEIRFDGFGFNRNRISFSADSNRMDLLTILDEITLNDSLLIDSFLYEAGMLDGLIDFRLQLQPPDTANSLDLRGLVSKEADFFKLNLNPQNILINSKAWDIDPKNQFNFSGSGIGIQDLKISHKNQSVKLSTDNIRPDSLVDIALDLTKLDLNDFSQLLKVSGIELKGEANGHLEVLNALAGPSISGNLNVEGLMLNSDTLGDLAMRAKLDRANNQIDLTGDLIGEKHQVNVNGSYPLNKKNPNINIDILIDRLDIEVINDHLTDFVYDADGKVNGSLKFSGTTSDPKLTGYLRLKNVEASVQYLHTHYLIEDGKVFFNEDGIDLSDLEVFDENGDMAEVKGGLKHQNLKDWRLDLSVFADQFQFLKTTYEQNPDFYGEAICMGNAKFSGPFNDIKIQVVAKSLKGTNIALVVDESGSVGEYGFMNFISSKQDSLDVAVKEKKKGAIEVLLDLDVTTDANLELVMDMEAGDRLVAKGAGNVNITVDKSLNVNLFGSYTIASGGYLFTLQNVFTKRFSINPGSNIIFNGDPYQAIIDVSATYTRSASTYNLISEYLVPGQDDEEISRAQNASTYNILFELRGQLSQPDIQFNIEISDLDPSIRTTVENKLALLRNNETDMNKQVFGLLLIGQFLPTNSGSAGGTNPNLLAQGVGNTISEFLSTQLSYYLSDALNAFGSGITVDIDYRQYGDLGTISEEGSGDLRQSMNIALQEEFFNDRVTVRVGGGFDVGTDFETDQNTATFIGDVQVEYSITADGRIRIKAFSKTDYDVWTNGNQNRTGVGITFREEFDTGKELFSNIKERRKNRQNKKNKDQDPDAKNEDEILPEEDNSQP